MAAITFVLLAHERSDDVAEVVDALVEGDPTCRVVIHYDRRSSSSEYAALRKEYRSNVRIAFVEDRVACSWGQFGLVEATVRALKLIQNDPRGTTHVYLLSGSCMPIRSLAELHAFLDKRPATEFIESETIDWVTGGLKEERYRLWFPLGIKSHPTLFNNLTKLQRKLKVKRRFPADLTPRFGSQWWCLTWKTCAKILEWIAQHQRRYRYFKSVWIPDECFFQTLTWKFARQNISNRPLTFYRFNKYGKPLVFHDDHNVFLTSLPYFFARKISYRATKLRAVLKMVASGQASTSPILDATTKAQLSYESLLGETQSSSKPGQLFHPSQVFKTWPGILPDLPRSFGVLLGPPALTRIAANILRNCSGLSVMGRLLRPGEVDFGPSPLLHEPLRPQDAGIRDLDPALYLARVFDRVVHFPVFELTYSDAPELVRHLFKLPNAIVLPILPLSNQEVYSSLFWLLSLPETAQDEHAYLKNGTPLHQRQQVLKQSFDKAFTTKSMEAIARNLFKDTSRAELRFIAAVADTMTPIFDRKLLEFQHGRASVYLADAISYLDNELARRSPGDLEGLIPDAWREHFRPLIRHHML